MKKDKLIEIIQDLPKEFNLEELIEKLIFIEKVEKGLEQLEKGSTLSHDEVRNQVRSWQK